VEALAHASTHPEALVGDVLGERFELVAFVASGGMGHVYRARDRTSGATVAVKLLALEAAVERFAREAAALASIDHPGVVRYLAHGVAAGTTRWLAMEWLDGVDLAGRLGAGPLDVDGAITVARCAAEALGAVHRRGVVHRDLKPSNLFLVGGKLDALKLIDFGVARVLTGDDDETMGGTVVGTPAYMAPEQVRGGLIGPRTDVYGLGAVVFRCLAGCAPFHGTHGLAVMAKVLLEAPPSLRELRPDVPPALDALVARMLAKSPLERPESGEAVVEELRTLGKRSPASLRRVTPAITAREQRVACVVLCAGTGAADATIDELRSHTAEEIMRRAVEQRGGAIDALARGGWLLTVPSAPSPAEQAMRAAQCALALAAIRPEAPLFVATGRVVVTGEHRVGEVIDRAADALVEARHAGAPGGVRVDAATAELLEGRFRVEGDGEWRMLVDEVSTLAPVRTLLGKPSPCVGREQPLALLAATLETCIQEPRASSVLVTAGPGLGKTRLVHELARGAVTAKDTKDATRAREAIEIHFANGDPIRAASPFGIAGELLKRASGVLETDTPRDRARKLAAFVARDFVGESATRVREMLGEISGVLVVPAESSASLRAARADLSIMADAIREAWIDWLRARTARGPVMLLLEDLHWADAASVRLVEDAFASLTERPLFVLATARPDARPPFGPRFREGGLVEITLAPLSPRASERLVREALPPGTDEALVLALARRAGGHPFYLEELVRAVARGRGEGDLPDSVLGMVQARLDDLGAEARRVLRAASVFGDTFWAGGVAALLGDDVTEAELASVFAKLVEQEVVVLERASTWRSEVEYRFRHALLREGAYAMLADGDRLRAHRRAAAWLERVGEDDPAVLADHYARGSDAEHALLHLRQAAARALQRNDFDRAIAHVTRARALGPDETAEGAFHAIEAEVAYWRGDFANAAALATQATNQLAEIAPEWFDAAAVAIGALGQLGRNDAVATWLERAASVASPPESRAAHVVTLARGATQLLWAHSGGDLAKARKALDALAGGTDALDPFLAGWVHRVRGESAWIQSRDVDRALTELGASCDAFDGARATRALCLTRMNAASLTAWSGAPGRALEMVARSRGEASHLGAGFLLKYGLAVEGLARAYAGDPTAESVMRRALGEVQGSPRLAFICRFVLGHAALERGDTDAADVEARAARAIAVVNELRPAGLALASRVALARGALDEAVKLAEEGERMEASQTDLELTHGAACAALAEAHVARGDRDRARVAVTTIVTRLSAVARTIADDAQRDRFWSRRLANDRVVRLARDLGVAVG
jgi:tetratricopeptide (TPR) repeat protein